MTAFRSILPLILVAATTGDAQPTESAKIDAFISPFAQAGHFSGVVLVARDGKPFYEKAFGFANAELGVRNQLDTRIGIASITKPMTAVIVRRLVADNKLAMSDKVTKFIPDFPNGDKITVGILYRHRSGIPHRVMPPEMETVPYTSAEMVERVKLAKLEFEPDTRRLYSSAGYSVLARILEIASGKTYAELLDDYVFSPAKMTSSLEYDGARITERRADDYLLDATGPINAPAKDYSFLIGAGSVLSTARDIHSFVMAVVSGAFGDSVRAGYLQTNEYTANGSTNGHRAEVRVMGRHNYSYALVSNLNSGANDVILQAIRDIMEGKTVSAPEVRRPTFTSRKAAELPQYYGSYQREDGSRFEASAKASQLLAGDIKLFPTGRDCFFEYRFYGDVCFVRDGAGKITHATWASPGVTSTWLKQ